MRNLIIAIVLLVFVGCKKDEVQPTTPAPMVTPKPNPLPFPPMKCDPYHYGDSCEIPFIKHYIGTYSVTFEDTYIYGSDYNWKYSGTRDIKLSLINGSYVFEDLFQEHHDVKVVAKSQRDGMFIPPMGKIRGKQMYMDTLIIKKGYSEHYDFQLKGSEIISQNGIVYQSYKFNIMFKKKN